MNYCIFCLQNKVLQPLIFNNELDKNQFFFIVKDINPVDKLHLLIISKEHFRNYSELSIGLKTELYVFLDIVCKILLIDRFSIQINNKYKQEINHFHLHLISDLEIGL